MESKDFAYIVGILLTAIIGIWNLWSNTQKINGQP